MLTLNIDTHKPLRELVYDELKRAILSGEFKAGKRLMEVELAKELGVSRTPVREALRKLERDKLLRIEPRKGVYVRDISLKDILDVLQIREVLEGLAAFLAASNMTEEQKDELKKAKETYEQAVKEDDKLAMVAGDTLFHKLIVDSCGNNYLSTVCDDMRETVQRFRSKYFHEMDLADTVCREHAEIYAAIEEGMPVRAKTASSEHTDSLREAMRDYAEKNNIEL